jgi:anti-sigma factor RsiW
LNELNDYLDGGLDPKIKAELEEHLIWCKECTIVCDTTRKTIAIYKNNEVYELPEDLRNRLHSAILSKCKAHKQSEGS